jgi:hypothetical protein
VSSPNASPAPTNRGGGASNGSASNTSRLPGTPVHAPRAGISG